VGRPLVPISNHQNPTVKYRQLQMRVSEWAGSKKEGFQVLDSFFKSSFWKKQCPDKVEDEIKYIYESISIGMDLCESVNNELSVRSKEILNVITKNHSTSELQQVLRLSRTTLNKVKKQSFQLSKHTDVKVSRVKVPGEEIQEIQKFLLEACPVKSGEPRTIKVMAERKPKHTQQMSDEALYQTYVDQFSRKVSSVGILYIFSYFHSFEFCISRVIL